MHIYPGHVASRGRNAVVLVRPLLIAFRASLACAPVLESRKSTILSREHVVLEAHRAPLFGCGKVTAEVLGNDVLVYIDPNETCVEQSVERRLVAEQVVRGANPWVLGFDVFGFAAASAGAVGGLVVELNTPRRVDRPGPGPGLFVAFFSAIAMVPFGAATMENLLKHDERTTKHVETVPVGESRFPCRAVTDFDSRPAPREVLLGPRDGTTRRALVDAKGAARFEIDETTWDKFHGALDVDITVDEAPTLCAVLRRQP